MQSIVSEPTPEMVSFYDRRTREHIERVRCCLRLIAPTTVHAEELVARGKVHDASKFGLEEYIPYIWLTELHRCRRNGAPFRYPVGMEAQVEMAIAHHMRCNRHHPEHFADANEMSNVDLIEMVCDWTAMAQEFGQDGGSARGWANKTIGNRVHFNEEKRLFVYEIIEQLDAKLRTT